MDPITFILHLHLEKGTKMSYLNNYLGDNFWDNHKFTKKNRN